MGSFSYNVSVTRFYQLDGNKMIYISRRRKVKVQVHIYLL